ncbi:MaoC family dehydratase N-terminal domain-containing protein [Bradyrhizobium sp. BWA-3-5]|uniref:FAS1-like dehydratase domain-containing protein n=1 Tax=Bradyrhizobium sp. BWA-3-5 TaxID=3080013 RepID=UPI00293F13F0|nr:MaoC family dehydratase N-terminal domain-containing protein [Bradyrhizobium sp. BWA-3-5]WOH63897.1 MaoC family dehydratase N-terminal domain-containing protein [Bradyrhizobium sp. BWA-3-5]
MALLTDELKGWIGREVHYAAREELGRASIRYFALATGDENQLYLDDSYAQEAGYPSLVAPPTLVCETCQYAHRRPDTNGYIGHEWHLPIPDCRIIRAGNDYEFIRPVLPDDRISVTWTLEDIVERGSSRGGTQLFISSVARYRDAAGKVVALNRETVVYQPMGRP